MSLTRLKPAVPKHWLIAIAGLVWLAAGVMLCHMAWRWLTPLPHLHIFGLVLAGLALALVCHRFMLNRIARRNMGRICTYAERGCVFAFQAWRSYLMILVMISIGSFLRHTMIPREILALLYTAMGSALIFSSLAYFSLFWQVRVMGAPCPPNEENLPY
jgi:acyl-CoA synthetase (AMP-forming)/AMP-acid ligase II